MVAQKRVKKEDSNKAYVPRSLSEGKYQMGKCWGLSTSVPKKVNPPPTSLSWTALEQDVFDTNCVHKQVN